MKTIKILNPDNISEEEANKLKLREASRAVVVDQNGNIALLHVANENYYKLPGGGIEGSEDKIEALKRECKEEIGCDIEVKSEIGTIFEYKKKQGIKQTSYGYTAKVVGEKCEPDFTEEEKGRGMKIVWLPYDDALTALKKFPNNFDGYSFITERDSAILEEAKKYLDNI